MTKAIMIQGAGSNVGKSMLVAGIARAATRRGLSVAPFKPQNMSNNAAVTTDGGEIGRAQALQARACGLEPHTDMNPVLLKPETDVGAQVIVQGKRFATLKAREYGTRKADLIPKVMESYRRLAAGTAVGTAPVLLGCRSRCRRRHSDGCSWTVDCYRRAVRFRRPLISALRP